MLPSPRRIKRPLFTKGFSGGRSISAPHLTLRTILSDKAPRGRFAFVVSKKVSPKAVGRNVLRRRGYAAIRRMRENLTNGRLGIFFFKKGADKLSYSDIEKQIRFLLERALTQK